MCVSAEFVSSEWVPLHRGLIRFWRIKRIKFNDGDWVGSMGINYTGYIAYVRTWPVWFSGLTNLRKPSQWAGK